MTRSELIQFINANIYPNGRNQITAPMVRDSILAVVGFLGDAAVKDIGAVLENNTDLVTGGAVYDAIRAYLSSVMKMVGETTTDVITNPTANPVYVDGEPHTAQKGDVVVYGYKEFWWTGSIWKELGDEASWALKTISITGTGDLTGGGSLEANRTLDLTPAAKDKLAHGETAFSWLESYSTNRLRLKSPYSYLNARKGLILEEETDYTNTPADFVKQVVTVGETEYTILRSKLPIVSDSFISAGGISPGGGASAGNATLVAQTYGGTLSATGIDEINFYSKERVDQLLLTAGKVQTVAGVSPTSGDIPVASLKSALGLGAAAAYGIGSVASGNTGLVTGGSVYSAINEAVSSVMKMQGTTTTPLSDGSTTNPVVIDGLSYTAKKGDMVVYGGNEFLWVGNKWQQMGDESSYALKTIQITGTGYLTGGGDLTQSRTLDISETAKGYINHGEAAYNYFPGGVLDSTHLPSMFIGTTSVQFTAAAQNLTGISSVRATNDISTLFEWDVTNSAWHFHGNIYTDGWFSGGGISPGGGGGGVIDPVAMWRLLTNDPSLTQYDNYTKISADHINFPVTSVVGLTGAITAQQIAQGLNLGSYAYKNSLSASDIPDLSGTYVTLSTAQTISGKKTFASNTWEVAGEENGQIADKVWENDTYYTTDDSAPIFTLASIRHAIRFRWYNDYYDIGVIRGGSSDSVGFGIGKENSGGVHVNDLFRVNTSGAWVIGNPIYHSGNLTKSVLTGLLDANGGYYLPLAGGTMTGQFEIGNGTRLCFVGVQNVSYDYTIDNRTGFGILFKSTFKQDQGVFFSDYGDVTARSFHKIGGTSAQFLKADGTVDSNTYLTTREAASTYLPLSGGTMTGQLTLKDFILKFQSGSTERFIGYYSTFEDLSWYTGSAWTKLWHSGNSNLSTVPWACSTLTASGGVFIGGGNLQIKSRGAEYLEISSTNVNINYNAYDSDGWCSHNFQTNGTTFVCFSGNNQSVGIGTTSPTYKLDVNGSIGCSTLIAEDGIKYNSDDATLAIYRVYNSSTVYGYETAAIQTCFDGQDPTTSTYTTSYPDRCVLSLQPRGGRVAVGQPYANYALDVAGVIHASTGIFTDGWFSGGGLSQSSDRRLKKSIKDFAYSAALLMSLRPREWDWNDKSKMKGHAAGFVAQEIEGVMPYSVDNSRNFKALFYDNFHAVEIAGLQDHERRIVELERAVKERDEKIKKLEKMLKLN